MTLKHKNKTFEGLHGRVIEMPPQSQHVETNFYGIRGTSIITSHAGARDLSVEYWLFNNFTDFIDINIELREIDGLVGQVGSLKVTSTPATDSHQLYKNVVFLGYERQAFPGQTQGVPIPDSAGTVDGGYHVFGILRFRQAIVD